MSFSDDDPPPWQKSRLEPLALDALGVEELTLYISELEAEIARVRGAIAAKRAHAAAASLFFKPPG